MAGRVDEAVAVADRALRLTRECSEHGHEAWVLRLLGEISIRRHHLGLGKFYHRTDKREQAQDHLATATTMYREMGMTFWLEKAEAEMAN
jgi:hypothetical protein